MGKRPAGSWENRPEWVIEVMTTNPTPRERAKWSMLKFTLKENKIQSGRANGSNVTRFMLEDALALMPLHWEQNVRPWPRYKHSTYRFRNLVSNEVIPWELLNED